jgi:hypothetical protein
MPAAPPCDLEDTICDPKFEAPIVRKSKLHEQVETRISKERPFNLPRRFRSI